MTGFDDPRGNLPVPPDPLPRSASRTGRSAAGMKVAVIGGGSTYTPELVSGLSRERERVPVDELVLHDIDRERRTVVGEMAARMLERQGFGGTLTVTDDLDAAVDGAAFVLLQLRVGGQAARLRDETIPLACGCIGQETTGAGGFAKAMRTVPVVLEIAERVRALARPDAWIVDFTNPVGIVTRALLDAGHRAIGLCNVAIGVQREVARLLGIAPERVLVDHVGLNHLTWVRRVVVDGRDVLPELLVRHGQELARHAGFPLRLLEELGAIPSSYLRYFYAHDALLAEQRDGVPRAVEVARIEAELLEIYRDAEVAEKPALLEQRGGAYYSEAATALIASLSGDTGDVQVVDIRNGGVVDGLQDDDVVELPARVGAAGAVPLPQAPLAPELLGLVQHVAAYERLTAEAAVTRDPVTARKALLTHPLVGQDELAGSLLDALLAEEAVLLAEVAR
jgi:6-phospho-beta-glucosidase